MAELAQIYLNSAVAINVDTGDASGSPELVGTGFLIIELVKGDNNKTVARGDELQPFCVFLVTNKHVITALSFACKSKGNLKPVIIRLRSKQDGKPIEYRRSLYDRKPGGKRLRKLWVDHPEKNIDISVIYLYADLFREDGGNLETSHASTVLVLIL